MRGQKGNLTKFINDIESLKLHQNLEELSCTRTSSEPHGPPVFVSHVLHALLVVALQPVAEGAVVVILVIDVVLNQRLKSANYF